MDDTDLPPLTDEDAKDRLLQPLHETPAARYQRDCWEVITDVPVAAITPDGLYYTEPKSFIVPLLVDVLDWLVKHRDELHKATILRHLEGDLR